MRTAFLSANPIGSAGLELFEFQDPRPEERSCFETDYRRGGYFHIALTVDNIDNVVATVMSQGGKSIGPIMPISRSHKATYVTDKWGNVIELMTARFEDIVAEAKDNK